MERWLRMARAIGIWIFGLLASAIVGGIMGGKIPSGYDDEAVSGALAGMFAFACIRLWLGEIRARNSN